MSSKDCWTNFENVDILTKVLHTTVSPRKVLRKQTLAPLSIVHHTLVSPFPMNKN